MHKKILNRNQTSLSISLRSYRLIKLLATVGKRKLSQQIEFLAEEECKRQKLPLPTETNGD